MLKKPDVVYLYQGDVGKLADALGSHMQISPREVAEGLYMFGASLELPALEERLHQPDTSFVLIEVRNYASQGTGTPLMGALFEMF